MIKRIQFYLWVAKMTSLYLFYFGIYFAHFIMRTSSTRLIKLFFETITTDMKDCIENIINEDIHKNLYPENELSTLITTVSHKNPNNTVYLKHNFKHKCINKKRKDYPTSSIYPTSSVYPMSSVKSRSQRHTSHVPKDIKSESCDSVSVVLESAYQLISHESKHDDNKKIVQNECVSSHQIENNDLSEKNYEPIIFKQKLNRQYSAPDLNVSIFNDSFKKKYI